MRRVLSTLAELAGVALVGLGLTVLFGIGAGLCAWGGYVFVGGYMHGGDE